MAQEQFSLFSGLGGPGGDVQPGSSGAGATEPAPGKARRKAGVASHVLPDLALLPIPPKVGPALRRFGTSSWTYPGWHGTVYRDVQAYGASQRFTELCLSEYARDPRFRCAGADNMYYMAPSSRLGLMKRYVKQLAPVADAVGDTFELCPKVWHGISVNRYSAIQREQWKLATDVNPHFLDPGAFLNEVSGPLTEGLGRFLGPILLEIQENDIQATEFVQMLDEFLLAVRGEFQGRLAVELRTQSHFTPRYLDTLHTYGVSHVLNSWTRVPPIGWQYDKIVEHGERRGWPKADFPFFLVRALLRPGVRYDDASVFEPYDRLVQRAPEVRADIVRVLRDLPAERSAYVLVNNHLEGHSPGTIAEIQRELWPEEVEAEVEAGAAAR